MRENGELMSRSVGQDEMGHYGVPVGSIPPGPKVASIKARPSASKRMTAAELEGLLHASSASPPSTPTGRSPQVYASVAEMKKAKVSHIY